MAHTATGRAATLPCTRRKLRVSRWWLNRSVRMKGLTVLTLPMLAFVIVASAGLSLQLEEHSERRVVIALNKLPKTASKVLADALDAETGVRGYVGTGDPLFLAPYLGAVEVAPTDLSALRVAALTGSAAQQQQVMAIETTFDAEMGQLSDLRNSVRANTAPIQTFSAELQSQKSVMDRLRVEVADYATAPALSVTRKIAAIGRLEVVIDTVEVTGLTIGVLTGMAGIALFTSGISRRLRVAADNAGRLGQGEDLLPVHPSADELGQLNASLIHAEGILTSRLEELAAARDQAVMANKSKDVFLSRTSHELRTPLNAILGFAQLLSRSELTADDRESTALILDAGRHLLALINELIDTANVAAGEMTLTPRPILLAELTSSVASLIGPLAAARGITVHQDRADDPLAVEADETRLRQVMVNLASNAVKYNRHGGMITLGYRLFSETEVEIRVSDTGAGLTVEDRERIFVPFERLDAERHGIEGTGIGLPLALAITRAMQGTLRVESVLGEGSTFVVRLPRADAAAIRFDDELDLVVPPSTPGDLASLAPLVVLSIEDNPTNALVLMRFFRPLEHVTFYGASSGHSGILIARERRPDLILLDLHLPDMPGEEVFAQLQSDDETRGIPVVIVSADATPQTVRRLLETGVHGYLTKPIDLQELHALLAAFSAAQPMSTESR